MTESYSDVNFVVRYYGNGTHEGAQMPFNFELMNQLTSASTAPQYVTAINTWLDKMPANHSANWVVFTILITLVIQHKFLNRFSIHLVRKP
jgi:alpha-glucosidase